MEVDAEAHRAERLDLVQHLRFDDSRPPRGKLELLDVGFKDAIAKAPFEHDDLRPGADLRSMGPPEVGGDRTLREDGRPAMARNALGERLHRGG